MERSDIETSRPDLATIRDQATVQCGLPIIAHFANNAES